MRRRKHRGLSRRLRPLRKSVRKGRRRNRSRIDQRLGRLMER